MVGLNPRNPLAIWVRHWYQIIVLGEDACPGPYSTDRAMANWDLLTASPVLQPQQYRATRYVV